MFEYTETVLSIQHSPFLVFLMYFDICHFLNWTNEFPFGIIPYQKPFFTLQCIAIHSYASCIFIISSDGKSWKGVALFSYKMQTIENFYGFSGVDIMHSEHICTYDLDSAWIIPIQPIDRIKESDACQYWINNAFLPY